MGRSTCRIIDTSSASSLASLESMINDVLESDELADYELVSLEHTVFVLGTTISRGCTLAMRQSTSVFTQTLTADGAISGPCVVYYVPGGKLSVFDGDESHCHDISGGGVVINNYADGANATFYPNGTFITSLPGLVDGENYVVDNDGTLVPEGSATPGHYSRPIGIAVDGGFRVSLGEVYAT